MIKDIDKIESVQRFFTKRLSGLWNTGYSERLKLCNVTSLELRRLQFDLVLCYKIIHNLSCLNFSDYFIFDSNTVARGHNLKLRCPSFKTTCRQHALAV